MKQEDKELLLKDLCARLPYGVKILYNGWDSDGGCEFSTVETLIGIDDRFIYTLWRDEKDKHSIVEPLSITDYKPYLRPMESMTIEEICKIEGIIGDGFTYSGGTLTLNTEEVIRIPIYKISKLMQFIYLRHLDFNNLIPMGLALEAPEGMYN